jgi:DNA-binding LacI/PurR family transcriptional regulator
VVAEVTNPSRPTLQNVASMARVSKATASRVINGEPNVSPAARQAVEEAIARLGYVPNQAARSLTTRRANSIALVVPGSDPGTLADPYCMTLAFVAGQTLSEADIQQVLVTVQRPDDYTRLLRYAKGGHVDGVILVSLHGADPLPELMHFAGIPVVVGGRPPRPRPGLTYVDVDNVAAARSAVEHLAARGRRRIATLAGSQDMCSGIDRLTGYREAIAAAGQARALVGYGEFNRDTAEKALLGLLDDAPDLDAVYAASDVMAARAVRLLQRRGRRVPDDVAVVGNDDLGIAQHTDPPLSTVRQPVAGMARCLVERILSKVDGVEVPDVTVLPTEFVTRMSS